MLSKFSNNISIDRKAYDEKLDRTFSLGVVADVILDESHREIYDISGDIVKDLTPIGAIVVKSMTDYTTRDEQFTIAYPLDRNFINLPVKNELVEIIQSGTGKAYYRVGDPTINPSETANLDNLKAIRSYYDLQPAPSSTNVANYKKSSRTKIALTGSKKTPYDDERYGEYYQKDEKLHRLQLYEGDLLVESRFGQSIRFSAYDNKDKKWYPCVTIRNRENDLSRNEKKKGKLTLEDINRDGSIIIMSSFKKVLPFQPGTVNKANKSDFVTKPISWPNYPSVLDGDQTLINSGRIIISSKTKEMIFWSKGNTGFISDGHWSWDFAKGITGDIGGNWHVTTNNFDFRVFAGHRGRCILGSGPNLQNIPRGNDLIQWLAELIDLIITNIYYMGPGTPPQTLPGPLNNIPGYLALRARLPGLLSKLNYTGNEPEVSRIGKDQAGPPAPEPEEVLQKRLAVKQLVEAAGNKSLSLEERQMLLEEGERLVGELKTPGPYGMSFNGAGSIDIETIKETNSPLPIEADEDECAKIGMKIVEAARADIGLRETSPNRGPEIDKMLKDAKLGQLPPTDANGRPQAGYQWCAAAVYKWWKAAGLGDVLEEGESWIRNFTSGAAGTLTGVWSWQRWGQAKNERVKFMPYPVVGAAVIYKSKTSKTANHIGIVETIAPNGQITTIEGNTNNDGSNNGNGVYRRKPNMTNGRIQGYVWPPSCLYVSKVNI